MSDITKYLVTTGNVAILVVIVLLIITIFGLFGWWLYRLIKYNKRTVVRTVIGNNVIVQVDWSKEYKDKRTGAYYWKLKKRKHRIPRPPSLALDVTNKGKEWVEMFYTGQGQYVPCKTTKPDFAQDQKFIETFQPITESQRQTYADQYEKSLGYKKMGLMDLLQMAMPVIALIMILAIFMLFFGDTVKPIADMSDKVSAAAGVITENLKSFSETQLQIVEKLQNCGGTVVGGKITPGNFTPPD